ncbi:MAG TPA: hypothetical protein VNQ79_06650 [Blastocatellia bacterium]|nr:hypothetical protein [Blastocatellia bacterium]
MPGISLRDVNPEIIKSSWLAFIGCNVPALDAGGKPGKITLAADAASGWKTPDASENPNAFFLGATSKGWQGQGQTQTSQEFCDEFTAPIATTKDSESFIYEADLMSVLNEKILTTVYGLEALHQVADAFQHYRVPSNADSPEMSFLLLTRRLVSGTYKYAYLFAPTSKQTASFGQGNYTRTESFKSKLRMEFQLYSAWGTTHTIWYEE